MEPDVIASINPSTRHKLDDEHTLIVLDSGRAWIVDSEGTRVSITWERDPDQDQEAFVHHVKTMVPLVLSFISPAN